MSRDAIIYNIQHYSLHDGPGIRTVVFFKGCPLRCRWCCNPESQAAGREISYVKSKCIGKNACGYCGKSCADGAVSFEADGRARIDRKLCTGCLKCAGVCPSLAIRAEGRPVGIPELLDAVEKDAVFYRGGTGGLTVSGGEPLFQAGALIDLLREAKKRRINTAIETCGFAGYDDLQEAAAFLDTILYDIKSMDGDRHEQFTGQDNTVVLDNFVRLCGDFPDLKKIVRTPVIPGFNDSVEDIADILAFIKGKPNVTFEALPYHRFGAAKYEMLGREYQMTARFNASVMKQIEALHK